MSRDEFHVDTTDGRSLIVRSACADDVDGLVELYATLNDDDRYLRFFAMYRPDRSFFEQRATAASRGGAVLVVELTEPGAPPLLVADAGYTMLDNGNAELDIVVAKPWRGGLGRTLLDALCAHAAANGVPNLEAEVLIKNRAMLALAHTRVYVNEQHDDWSTIRVVIGTSAGAPSWPPADRRPRVLVEAPHGRWTSEAAARTEGLHVLTCPGPGTNRCPLLWGQECPLARDADAIVFAGDPQDERWAQVLSGHRTQHSAVPLCVDRGDGIRELVAIVPQFARRQWTRAHDTEAQ